MLVRERLESADKERRAELEGELASMRQERAVLGQKREAAFFRKMVMLGHLPSSALID